MTIRSEVTFRDKLLPTQPVFREYFEGDDKKLVTALYDAILRFGGIPLPEEKFEILKSDRVSFEELTSSPVVLQFLQSLILIKNAKRVLEIGTFLGISTMYMASVLPEGGQVVTIEKYDHFAHLAANNFRINRLDNRIELIVGDALSELPRLESTRLFDLIFLDGHKEKYYEYFDLLDHLLVHEGVFVIDDIFFCGDVLNDRPKSEKGLGVKKFLEISETYKNYHKLILPISNGIMLMVKL